ncbi:MAG: SDR family NAD(P)-dependent oxidoreductase [Brachymonas sp.]|jgi:short-subunit dehydrogenase
MPANAASKPAQTAGYALITGASTGIGRALAECFAQRGIPLILSASPRSAQALADLALLWQAQYGIAVHWHCADLGQEGAAQTLATWVDAQGLEVGYLVNNAGFGICEQALQDYDPARFAQMLQVNMLAPAYLLRHFLPAMVQRGHGRVLNVSSIAGYIYPHYLQGAYAASKAFMVSLSESCAQDLRGTGVTCTHLAPGPVRSAFFASAGLAKARPLAMTAEAVAQAGFAAMMAGKTRCIPGWGNQLAAFGARVSPSRRLVGWLAKQALR